MFLCSAMWCWKYLSSECEMWMGWKWITQQMRVQSRIWWQWLRMYWTWSLVLICEYKHSLIHLWLPNRFNSVNNRLRSFGWKNLSFLKTNFCSNSCSKHREVSLKLWVRKPVRFKEMRVQATENSSNQDIIDWFEIFIGKHLRCACNLYVWRIDWKIRLQMWKEIRGWWKNMPISTGMWTIRRLYRKFVLLKWRLCL